VEVELPVDARQVIFDRLQAEEDRSDLPVRQALGNERTARDAVDDPVPVACTPRSGTRFKISRTQVRCTATDTSGNIATARFVITVKRGR
jgi:hypothetical protein